MALFRGCRFGAACLVENTECVSFTFFFLVGPFKLCDKVLTFRSAASMCTTYIMVWCLNYTGRSFVFPWWILYIKITGNLVYFINLVCVYASFSVTFFLFTPFLFLYAVRHSKKKWSIVRTAFAFLKISPKTHLQTHLKTSKMFVPLFFFVQNLIQVAVTVIFEMTPFSQRLFFFFTIYKSCRLHKTR